MLCHMLSFAERIFGPEARRLELSLRIEDGALRYCLRADGGVLQYDNDGGMHRRILRGQAAPYAFRSIEQLRYDFERELEDLDSGDDAQA